MEYIIDVEDVGKRLDIYLSEKDKSRTRSYIKRLINEEKIKVNSNKVKSGYNLKLGDKVYVESVENGLENIAPEDIPLDIVYEDDDIIIINKKKGMVVHPANGNYSGTLVNALLYLYKDELSAINGDVRPGIVHRIDKDTTGILVIAKNDYTHEHLSDQFKEHSIKRKYIALVKGIIKEDEMTIDLPIGRNERDRKKMAVTTKNSKNAITHVKVLKRFYSSKISLVQATLETGRTHQIRVHLTHKGHPLVGDEVYGKKDTTFKVSGQVLHAKMLGFIHPRTGKYVEFISDLPKEFKEIIDKLEKKENASK